MCVMIYDCLTDDRLFSYFTQPANFKVGREFLFPAAVEDLEGGGGGRGEGGGAVGQGTTVSSPLEVGTQHLEVK